MTDEEIYERIVGELPFAADEEPAKIDYLRRRPSVHRMEIAHEILKRHWLKRGMDVDSVPMDKSVMRVVRRSAGTDYAAAER